MYRKLSKLGAVKTDRNWSRSERNVGVSCTGGLLVARVPGCCATPRIPPGRKEVAIPHAYLAPGKVRNPNFDLYLRYIEGSTGPDFHPCSTYLFAVSNASTLGIDSFALVLAVAIEGLVKSLHERPWENNPHFEGAVEAFKAYVLAWP